VDLAADLGAGDDPVGLGVAPKPSRSAAGAGPDGPSTRSPRWPNGGGPGRGRARRPRRRPDRSRPAFSVRSDLSASRSAIARPGLPNLQLCVIRCARAGRAARADHLGDAGQRAKNGELTIGRGRPERAGGQIARRDQAVAKSRGPRIVLAAIIPAADGTGPPGRNAPTCGDLSTSWRRPRRPVRCLMAKRDVPDHGWRWRWAPRRCGSRGTAAPDGPREGPTGSPACWPPRSSPTASSATPIRQ